MEAPLRIRPPAKAPVTRHGRRTTPAPAKKESVDSYVLRLIKLIPAEVVTAYLVGREIASSNDYSAQWALWCLIATFVFRSIMTFKKPDGDTPKWQAWVLGIEWPGVLIAMISFSIWVFSLGDSYAPILPSLEQWQATLVLLLWTPFAPLVYKGIQPKAPEDKPKPKPGTVLGQVTPGKSKKGVPGSKAAAAPMDPLGSLRMPEASEPRLAPRLPTPVRRDRIGDEDRTRVRDTSVAPFNQIILLHAFAEGEGVARKLGTGWFLTPRIVATAAHVVYDPAVYGPDGTAARVLGWPGYGGNGSGLPSFESTEINIHPQFENHLRKDCDIALLELEFPYDGLGIPLAGAMTDDVLVAGYPGDLGSGRTMFECDGNVVRVEQGFVFHNADTSDGQSGAPILARDGEQSAIGIHIDGKDRSDHLSQEANLGLLFHPEIQDWLKKF